MTTKSPTLLENIAAYEKGYNATEAALKTDSYAATEASLLKIYPRGVHTRIEDELEESAMDGHFQALRNHLNPPRKTA